VTVEEEGPGVPPALLLLSLNGRSE
jgi:hypothetical protein